MKRRMAGTLLQSKGMKSFGRYGAVGFELLASIAVGYYLGHWLDGKFGTRWIAFVGFLVGCYAGFSALFRTAKQMQRDIEREEKLERGEDPWGDDDDASDVVNEPPDDAREARATETTPEKREEP
ncbi:MAG: AtpZ/AtpI family protein [Labilithrix sp.]|nr:AtpZ/AtpI family protein [Labilithrix sp.]MBX3218179.1 AtpZ/AtpI family protein [Labilithrix sp.]